MKKFIKKYIEQILNILIILGIIFDVFMLFGCQKSNKEQYTEHAKLLYVGEYDVLLIDSDRTYVFIPSVNSHDNAEIKIYKKTNTKNDIDTISHLN